MKSNNLSALACVAALFVVALLVTTLDRSGRSTLNAGDTKEPKDDVACKSWNGYSECASAGATCHDCEKTTMGQKAAGPGEVANYLLAENGDCGFVRDGKCVMKDGKLIGDDLKHTSKECNNVKVKAEQPP